MGPEEKLFSALDGRQPREIPTLPILTDTNIVNQVLGRKEVEEEVARAAREARGGGFILEPAHSHPAIDATRVRWMIEAAHKTGSDPIP